MHTFGHWPETLAGVGIAAVATTHTPHTHQSKEVVVVVLKVVVLKE